jgi:hypothetical protein
MFPKLAKSDQRKEHRQNLRKMVRNAIDNNAVADKKGIADLEKSVTNYRSYLPSPVFDFILHVLKMPVTDRARANLLPFCEALLLEHSVTELLPLRAVEACGRMADLSSAVQQEGAAAIRGEWSQLFAALRARVTTDANQVFLLALDSIPFNPVDLALWQLWCTLLKYLCLRVQTVEALLNRQFPAPPARDKHGYNPPREKAAYYFGNGQRLRVVPQYPDLKASPELQDDIKCTKVNPSHGAKSYFFFVFCPIHGHCWGTLL